MQQPQIIGFGAQKAGTSWLAHNLGSNPAVWQPPLKEMHFFNHAVSGHTWMLKGHREAFKQLAQAAKGRPRRAAYIARVRQERVLSEEWYKAIYEGCPEGRVSYDITPAYALLPDEGLAYMHRLLGSSFKGLFLIRDPARRAASSFKSSAYKRGRQPDDLDYWVRRLKSENVAVRSNYRETIERLDRWLGPRMLYLPFRMIAEKPLELLRQVELHCGLPEARYRAATRPRRVSPGLDPTERVLEAFREELAEQYAFLESRFGREFMAKC